jgi:site-specific recombinase XerD
MTESTRLRLEQDGERWQLMGAGVEGFGLVNDYLGYLADRNYSPRTGRAYGYDLLAFCRWLLEQDLALEAVTTEVLLNYLRSCRAASVPGRPNNVVSLSGVRADRYSPTTINHRLAAVTGLFAFRTMRDPTASDPVPKGREARHVTSQERTGLLGHLATRPKPRSALRLREPKRLPRALDRRETTDLLGSLRSWRDRAIAGLMLFSGLRSCEVLALNVTDGCASRARARRNAGSRSTSMSPA